MLLFPQAFPQLSHLHLLSNSGLSELDLTKLAELAPLVSLSLSERAMSGCIGVMSCLGELTQLTKLELQLACYEEEPAEVREVARCSVDLI
jgi:hypothetical protein